MASETYHAQRLDLAPVLDPVASALQASPANIEAHPGLDAIRSALVRSSERMLRT